VAANPGTIAWTGSQLNFVLNTDIVLRLIQNESGQMVQLRANYGATNSTNTFNTVPLASGEVLYVELDRSLIPGSGDLVLENAVSGTSTVSGKTVKKATAGPTLADTMSGPSGTLSIPLAINIDGHLWWIPHGIYWPPGVSSPLGAVITSTSIPIGAVIPWHTFGNNQAYGYNGIKQLAPGFQLCDGSVIIDPQSPKFNPTRNPDGTPTPTYNPALDNFTPNINGEHVIWSNTVAWQEGDYVIDSGTRYVAIQDVPISTPISNTAYWQPESVYNNVSPSNPYNKYRKTTQNQGINTYLRGNNRSLAASNASAYGGSNTHQLTTSELPQHNHTVVAAGAHTHPGSSAVSNGSHNHTGSTGAALNVVVAPWSSFGFEGGGDGYAVGTFQINLNHAHPIPSDGDHTHSLSIVSDGSHTHTVNDTGNNQPHNNEPRYHNLVYIVRIY
jgi:microcystin-dependent protein